MYWHVYKYNQPAKHVYVLCSWLWAIVSLILRLLSLVQNIKASLSRAWDRLTSNFKDLNLSFDFVVVYIHTLKILQLETDPSLRFVNFQLKIFKPKLGLYCHLPLYLTNGRRSLPILCDSKRDNECLFGTKIWKGWNKFCWYYTTNCQPPNWH